MKRTIFIVLQVCLVACGQNKPGTGSGERFEAKFVRLIDDTSRMMLIQNVVISYGDLYAEVRIVLPHDPDPDLDELMERWRGKKPYDPRGDVG